MALVYEQFDLYDDPESYHEVAGKPTAFMVAVNWFDRKNRCFYVEFLEYLYKLAKDKKIGHTIIGLEKSADSHKETDGYHIHVYTWITDKTYHTMTQTLFSKWQLRGRAEKDKPRQYGKIKSIRCKDKMIAYTIKGRNVLTTLEEKELKDYLKISYVKEEPVNDMKHILLERYSKHDIVPTIDDVGVFIVMYHRQQMLKCPTLSYIKNVYANFEYDIKRDGKYIYSDNQIWNTLKMKNLG